MRDGLKGIQEADETTLLAEKADPTQDLISYQPLQDWALLIGTQTAVGLFMVLREILVQQNLPKQHYRALVFKLVIYSKQCKQIGHKA